MERIVTELARIGSQFTAYLVIDYSLTNETLFSAACQFDNKKSLILVGHIDNRHWRSIRAIAEVDTEPFTQ